VSVESLTVVLHHSRAKGTARLVLLGIANHDGDGGAWPALATLAKYAGGIDERNVRKALRTLEGLGELSTQLQAGGTVDTIDALRPNRYTITLACPFDCDRSPQHRTGRQLRLVTPVSVDPADLGAYASPGGASVPRGEAPASPGGGAPASPEPSIEPNVNTGVTEVRKSPRRGRAVDNPPAHDCDDGWLGFDDDERRVPCLLCKPHLARRRRTS
jgi:hypothetical protein